MADDDQQQGISPWSGWQESLASANDADLLRYYNIWRQANDPQAASPDASTFGGGLPAYGAPATPRSFEEYAWQMYNRGQPSAPPLAPGDMRDPFADFSLSRSFSTGGALTPHGTFAPPPGSFGGPAPQSAPAYSVVPPAFDEWQMLREAAAQNPVPPPQPKNLTDEQLRIFNERIRDALFNPHLNQFGRGLSLYWADDLLAPAYARAYGTNVNDELAVRREARRLFEEQYPTISSLEAGAGQLATTALATRVAGRYGYIGASTLADMGKHPENRVLGATIGGVSGTLGYFLPPEFGLVEHTADLLIKAGVPKKIAEHVATKWLLERMYRGGVRKSFEYGFTPRNAPANNPGENVSPENVAPESYIP